MGRVSYTSYRFRAPPLMDEAFFDYLKGLPVKEGSLRYQLFFKFSSKSGNRRQCGAGLKLL